MGEESVKEEILQFFRSLSTSLLSRVSYLVFDLMQSKSVGALAGFAIALVCTWKYMRAVGNRRKRLEKREDTADSSTINPTTATSSSVALHHTQPAQRGVIIREPEAPVELTTAQIVKKQLNGCRKMTCQLLGVILEETTPDALQSHAVVRPGVVDVLLKLAQACDLYLLTRVLDDESEGNVLAALEAVGLFSIGGLNRNKVLFCSTEAGRTSFVRQLEPEWHVDTSLETISQLARFIQSELHVTPTGSSCEAHNVVASESLESYFGKLG